MKFRRRQYIINAGMQMKYTLRFVLIALAGSLAATTVFNYYALKDLELAMYRTHTVHTTTADIIAPLFIYTNIVNIAFVLLLLVIIASWMMRKASGPVFRMSKDLLQ
ncbi:hypothetical protein H8E50_06690, partial [bacterium]|nr:hypothetical protein [bacterium]